MGGSSWAWIEGYRQPDYNQSTNLGFLMRDAGIPTDVSIRQCCQVPGLKVIGGGGIRSGLDIAKALVLGADLATCAKPFLEPALMSENHVVSVLTRFKKELAVSMFGPGAGNIAELKATKFADY